MNTSSFEEDGKTTIWQKGMGFPIMIHDFGLDRLLLIANSGSVSNKIAWGVIIM